MQMRKLSVVEMLDRLDAGDSPGNQDGSWNRFLMFTGTLTSDQLKIRKGHGIACPMCGGHDRFRYDNATGRGDWFCNQCGGVAQKRGGGRGWQLIKRLVGDEEAKRLLREYFETDSIVASYTPRKSPAAPVVTQDDPEIVKAIHGLWDAGKPFSTGQVPYYSERGIPAMALEGLQNVRFLPSLGYFIPNKDPSQRPVKFDSFPALLGRMQNAAGKVVAIHRTWLSHDKKAKATVPEGQSVKKLSRSLGAAGAAIRLFDATDSEVLGLSEGIESAFGARALAASGYFPGLGGLPVWSCYSAGVLQGFEIPPELLATLKTIVIFADNDDADGDKPGPGREVAAELARRLKALYPHIEVRIEVPPVAGCDWLDIWQNI